jgi:hypothetical protein
VRRGVGGGRSRSPDAGPAAVTSSSCARCAPFLRTPLTPVSCLRLPVPVAHGRSLPFALLFGAAVTSSSCASRAPSAGRVGWTPGHQFQLRIACLLPGSGRVERAWSGLRGVSGRRHAAGGMDRAPCCGPEGSDPSPVWGQYGDHCRNRAAHRLSPPFLLATPVTRDTSVATRLRSADQGDEPRMNGRRVEEVRGYAAVTA